MVERLKKAIEKARAEREKVTGALVAESAAVALKERPSPDEQLQRPQPETRPPLRPERAPPRPEPAPPAHESAWAALEEVALDPKYLERKRVIAYGKTDPAHIAFDVLRTRLLKVFKDRRWSRIAITSPGKGCGKTFVAANLALSLARRSDCRTILLDVDLKVPGVANTLGLTAPRSMEAYLTGQMPPESFLRRIGPNLAVGWSTERLRDSAELIQDARTAAAIAKLTETYAPDVVIFDLPPMLVSDDAIAMLPQVDCVLLVAAAGQTSSSEIEECERLLGDSTNFLGVLLNKCEDRFSNSSNYEYYE